MRPEPELEPYLTAHGENRTGPKGSILTRSLQSPLRMKSHFPLPPIRQAALGNSPSTSVLSVRLLLKVFISVSHLCKSVKSVVKFPWLRLAALLPATAALGAAAAPALDLPPETGLFRAGPGAALANAQCLVCHSVEYVSTQPPLPRAFWKASIDKMRAKFGAQIPDDQTALLVDYLVANYGKSDQVTSAPAQAPAASAPPPADARSVMVRHGCFNCHQIATKLVGPPYRLVAAKYAPDPGGTTRVIEQIKNGGGGKWGPIPMPPSPGLSQEELEKIARWILEQK